MRVDIQCFIYNDGKSGDSMNSSTGKNYDKIAEWWHNNHNESSHGLAQIGRAISYCRNRGKALDVGCGSGGRIIRKLLAEGFDVTGIDLSQNMIDIARGLHPEVRFHVADICTWESDVHYDFIVAWDSIFHLPVKAHRPVVSKLCGMLNTGGILVYTFGDAVGEHESEWHGEKFLYGSIGIDENLKVIMDSGCSCRHLELDQFPEKHVYVVAERV